MRKGKHDSDYRTCGTPKVWRALKVEIRSERFLASLDPGIRRSTSQSLGNLHGRKLDWWLVL